MLEAAGRIVAATDLPVTADLEGGYGDPAETVRRAIGIGVVGANIEDQMRPLAEALATVGRSMGPPEHRGQEAPPSPDGPREPAARGEVRRPVRGSMHLEPVQKWVLSILAATTIVHLAGGLVIAAMYVDDTRTDAQIGLNILAGAFGLIAVAVFRAIHQKKLPSAWLLLGVLPTFVGLWLTFRWLGGRSMIVTLAWPPPSHIVCRP